jgi:hypothetical protein
MSGFVNRTVRVVSSGLDRPQARRKSVEDVSKDDRDGIEKRPPKQASGDTELPPNENLKKDADEAYGDTEIPWRKHNT